MEQRSHSSRDPPSLECHSNRDPPSAYDSYVQNRRQQSKNAGNENGIKPYTTIRFSNNLEVYTKQPSNHSSNTPKRSILRTNSKGNQDSTKAPTGRRKDSLLEKIQKMSEDQGDTDSSGKIEPPGPVRPRRDWNIESLFPLEERKPENLQSVNRSRMVDPSGGIHTRVPKHEQYYSSKYLLNKYAVHSNGSPRGNVDGFIPKLDVKVSPCSSVGSTSTGVPITPKGGKNRQRRPFSGSKSNERLPGQRRFPTTRIGRKKELSYLQLEERNPNEDDPEFSINGGYDLGNLIQRYPVDSPRSSIASYDEILIRKSTSDTDYSDGGTASVQKRFDWDGHYEDKDFHNSGSKRPSRFFKPWAIRVLVGTVCFCFASSLIISLMLMDERGESPISNDKLDPGDCTHHDHANRRLASDRYNTIRSYLQFQSDGNMAMMDQPGSPQREALCWISEFDGYNINVTSGNEEGILQRYSLAVMYFSTTIERGKPDGDSGSIRNSNFLAPLHECDWDDIICNHSREITILRLSKKSLTGSIPLEIGNLINLSTYNTD